MKSAPTTFKRRNNHIRKLRFENKLTFNAIASRYGITVERVRQICQEPFDRNEEIKKAVDKYKKKFNNHVSFNDLVYDIEELSKQNRRKDVVARRKILIEYLHDELELPFYRIGHLLNRDHTTITHLYYD